jgi:hypothetical protein
LKDGKKMIVVLTFLVFSPLIVSAIPTEPDEGSASPSSVGQLFSTADQCMACHNRLVTNSGEDVSIGSNWRATMMANSARDPYWHAAVRREILDHPSAQAEIENECAACHMPMARFAAKVSGLIEDVFSHLPLLQEGTETDRFAADGVSCTLCHQIEEEGFGKKESFTAGFSVDTLVPKGQRVIHGPYDVDPGRKRIMRSASEFSPEQLLHVQQSEHCATCHTLFTHTLGSGGEVIGELPEQVPYLEWLHSDYRGKRSCQSCHMPEVDEQTPVSSVLGEDRTGFSRHAFRGGNFFMPRILNRHRDDLRVVALPLELDATSDRTASHLQSEAASVSLKKVQVVAGRLEAEVTVTNLAGHKLPTAYPSRRVWLNVMLRDRTGKPVFQSGRFKADGSIEGNDNDSNPQLFESHYSQIDSGDKVQIYEVVLVDQDDRLTTGLLTAIRYLKDNRILPDGFDKEKAADAIAVRGKANEDADFDAGRDTVSYSIPVNEGDGPHTFRVELWYQPIAYRWAQNLRQQTTSEAARFLSYFESLSDSSALILARDSATVR